MAIVTALQRCRSVFVLLSLLTVLSCPVVSYAVSEENSFVVSRHVGDPSLTVSRRREAPPCDSTVELRREGYLKQRVASADGAIATEPCIRQTTKACPVKCFRADPVCGTDKVTYWCGAADAKCAGVEVAHDGYCNLWESDTNIGSTTAVQSLQLNHSFGSKKFGDHSCVLQQVQIQKLEVTLLVYCTPMRHRIEPMADHPHHTFCIQNKVMCRSCFEKVCPLSVLLYTEKCTAHMYGRIHLLFDTWSLRTNREEFKLDQACVKLYRVRHQVLDPETPIGRDSSE